MDIQFWELIVIAAGLAMDAFAVSICKGLSVRKLKFKHMIAVGLYFGVFQALMPTVGYYVGIQFSGLIESYDHWVAFGLLLLIGANMVRESFSKEEEKEQKGNPFSVGNMLVLAVATSIDALAVGISFACLNFTKGGILTAALTIGVITCFLSVIGIVIGNYFGAKYKSKAELAGGLILIVMGTKILLEGLGII